MTAAKKKALKTLPLIGPTFTETASAKATLPDIVETIMPAVVNIYVAKGDDASSGSGFVIDGKNGYIVTNNHVIDDGSKIVVSFPDDNAYTAKLVGSDPMTDIAVLKLNRMKGATVPEATMGDSNKMRLGNSVIVIGNPFSFKSSVSTGIVSGLHRTLGNGLFDDYIQTDAAMNPGNSGGPLFNMGGQVIGVNTAIISGSGSSAGIGFAIPANQVRWTVEQIINHGVVRRAVMGLGIANVTSGLAEKFGVAARCGVHINSIVKNGPSWNAGLRPDDIILSMDGKDIKNTNELRAVVANHAPQETIAIDYWRKGEKLATTVTLGEAVWNKKDEEPEEDEGEDLTDMVMGVIKEQLKEELKEELRAELMQEFMQMFGGNQRPQPKRPIRPQNAPKFRR